MPDSLETHLNNICLENKETENQNEKWGLPLSELYRLAFCFYKEKSGKAIHLSYEDNLRLIAFTQHAKVGPFDASTAPQLGVFDVIGKDRRVAWQGLGDISKEQAMEGFINLLDRLCASLKPYIEAVKKNKEETLRIELEKKRELQEAQEKEKLLQDEQRKREEKQHREELQRRQLQDALNQQTYHQFKAYAEKQFPGNPEQQAVLIRQLQNEHYHQYMQQLHSQIKVDLGNSSLEYSNLEENALMEKIEKATEEARGSSATCELNNTEGKCDNSDRENSESGEYLVLAPAKMWTRPDIKAFKKEVSVGTGDGIIHVGHGDTVTVRVPTHEGGNCIFWEFATDSYDIGFGVYFEWAKPESNEVTVHVSESEDEDEYYEDDDDDLGSTSGDLECGPVPTHRGTISPNKPPVSILVPIYRRECQSEVYVGSHAYPAEGTYLLKFDNSFSVWRSKTLYYRVYYER